ncbi:MAG: tRNA uridine-5-carboxymethylaminomethyl(34) synthesis GTPase MnmE [Alphaproteobacteria bacterium]|nr:tRNA uridine-5-carboxymethylaminomethyl(34) synthesis GTPase MnmE [Alphaproteobacteria bacterium]
MSPVSSDSGRSGDTIFAPATAPGRAGIAVIRLSGPGSGAALTAICGDGTLPVPRRARLSAFADPDTGEVLDRGLVLWFPGPDSFTGEDVAELHCHGGGAVIAALLAVLARLPGCRPALPGEFTRRAFQNGKMDLTQAEALADLVAAETEAQRRQAQRQMAGDLGRLYEGWRADLIGILAHLEAEIDFPDEDLPQDILARQRPRLETLAGEISAHLDDGQRGERLREGCHMVILGAPNVGKSSLLNALARRDAAIVSAQAGTTRDIVEVYLNLGGYPVVLADTAGLRESGNAIEAEGVRRARARGAQADLKIVLYDCAATPEPGPAVLEMLGDDGILVANKIDRASAPPRQGLPLSIKTGEGLAGLLQRLEAEAGQRMADSGAPGLTRLRHRLGLEGCRDALMRGLEEREVELVAEDVRLAARHLGRITGRVDVEDILGVVFGEFCIGK